MNNKLWTKDFTIITVGSVISMLGNSLAGFATSLFVLDYTESTFLYAVYMFLYTLPQIISPILAGPLVDRFSRRRIIYTLDFISTGMYLFMGLAIRLNFFNFAFLAVSTLLLGISNGIYCVAFESFYPMLISEGNFSKAYSVASTLETMTFVMTPVSTFVYNLMGLFPLLLINAGCFLTAAIFETKISDVEQGIAREQHNYSLKRYVEDSKDGFRYLFSEKALLAVTLYFMVTNFASGASQVITLPWFRENFSDGEYIYLSVSVFSVIGRATGGMLHYSLKFPTDRKYSIALFVYTTIALIEAFYLYTGLWIMRIGCFLIGILGVTSYTIRASATQSYVPTERKGRFNGAFAMLNTSGAMLGQLVAGGLCEVIDMRTVLTGFMLFNAVSALIIIGGNKKFIKPLYNRQA